MTIAPPPRSPAMPAAPRPHQAGPGGAGGGGAATIDPVRLLKQYKVPLAAAAVVGIVAGIGAHIVLKRYWPQYRSTVTYQGLPLTTDIKSNNPTFEEQEFDRYLLTQTRIMTSERVLREAVRDPTLKNQNLRWIQPYILENGQVDQSLAARDLKEIISARPLTGTNLAELSVTAREPKDAAVLVNAVHEAYWRDLELQSSNNSAERRNALTKQLTDLRAEIARIESQRSKILNDYSLDAENPNDSAVTRQLDILAPQIVELDRDRERFTQQQGKMEQQLKAETGPVYDDAMRAEAERDPLIQNLNAEISQLTTSLEAQKAQGLGPNHRAIQNLNHLIAAKTSERSAKREEVLRKTFESTIERFRQTVDGIAAQRKELMTQLDAAQRRKQDVVRALEDYRALGSQREVLRQKESETRAALDNLLAINDIRSVERIDRMRRLDAGRTPDDVVFPRLTIMLPAGLFLIVGLTGAVIVLREVLDQRIKGPSDLALIPRMRLIGMVPLATDDPAKPTCAEGAFRECPAGAMAESFRQLRPALVKRMQQGGHRSLLLLGAMPGSGTTTVAVNLAMACATADHRVLLIDANFRRPAMHKILKLGEGPGLGDALCRKATLESAIQQTNVEGLHLLSAGSAQSRALPERLATETMTSLLREATDRYDLVLIDSAPGLVAGDAFALANRSDAVVLVVRAMAEKRGLIARLRDQLADTRAEFLGVVVNAVRASAGGYMRRNLRDAYEYQNNGNPAP